MRGYSYGTYYSNSTDRYAYIELTHSYITYRMWYYNFDKWSPIDNSVLISTPISSNTHDQLLQAGDCIRMLVNITVFFGKCQISKINILKYQSYPITGIYLNENVCDYAIVECYLTLVSNLQPDAPWTCHLTATSIHRLDLVLSSL